MMGQPRPCPSPGWLDGPATCCTHPILFGLKEEKDEAAEEVASRGSKKMEAPLVESFNASGWRSLKKRLMFTRASIVLAQETGITEKDQGMIAQWCKGQKWHFMHTPAIPCKGDGAKTSAGVAIFARRQIGLRAPREDFGRRKRMHRTPPSSPGCG